VQPTLVSCDIEDAIARAFSLASLSRAGYRREAIASIFATAFPHHSTENLAKSLAYVKDVMGRRLEDIHPITVVRASVPRNVAPRYTVLRKMCVREGRGMGGGRLDSLWAAWSKAKAPHYDVGQDGSSRMPTCYLITTDTVTRWTHRLPSTKRP
jgi:hypothetical protein